MDPRMASNIRQRLRACKIFGQYFLIFRNTFMDWSFISVDGVVNNSYALRVRYSSLIMFFSQGLFFSNSHSIGSQFLFLGHLRLRQAQPQSLRCHGVGTGLARKLTMPVDLFVDTILQKPDRYLLASRKTETRSFKLTFIRRCPYDLDPGTLIKVSSSCVERKQVFTKQNTVTAPYCSSLMQIRNRRQTVHELCRFTEYDSAKEIKF